MREGKGEKRALVGLRLGHWEAQEAPVQGEVGQYLGILETQKGRLKMG